MQIIKELARTIIVVAVLVAGVSLVSAWTAPTQTPPGGNVSAPVNVGALSQIKSGTLQVNGFRNIGNSIFDGNVGIGTAAPTQKLDVVGDIKTNAGIWLGGVRKTEWPSGGGVLTKVTYAVGKDCGTAYLGYCYFNAGILPWPSDDEYFDVSTHYNKVCEIKGAKVFASDAIGIGVRYGYETSWGWDGVKWIYIMARINTDIFGMYSLSQISCWK